MVHSERTSWKQMLSVRQRLHFTRILLALSMLDMLEGLAQNVGCLKE